MICYSRSSGAMFEECEMGREQTGNKRAKTWSAVQQHRSGIKPGVQS